MDENFLHHIWEYRLFEKNIQLVSGEKIEVIDTGRKNTDAGPDFFNVHIRIGDTLWVGNAEIHFQSSDWIRHGHNKDKAYDNVILHLVLKHDIDIKRSTGTIIPTALLQFNEVLFDRYQQLHKSRLALPCQPDLHKIDRFLINAWMIRLAIERLEKKAISISNTLANCDNDWEEAFYQSLAKTIGLKVNAQPFEMLANTLPLKYLRKQHGNLLQTEAFLFGQAALIPATPSDEYTNKLIKEYNFLAHKFRLKPMERHLWKFHRLRPVNFPTIRIAQLAAILEKKASLFAYIIEIETIEQMIELFTVSASSYWTNHYQFDREVGGKEKHLGLDTIRLIIINSVIPFLFLYGRKRGMTDLEQRAIGFLEELPAESNNIIDMWTELKVPAGNALASQALIQLKNEYCDPKKCLNCSIGNKIIELN